MRTITLTDAIMPEEGLPQTFEEQVQFYQREIAEMFKIASTYDFYTIEGFVADAYVGGGHPEGIDEMCKRSESYREAWERYQARMPGDAPYQPVNVIEGEYSAVDDKPKALPASKLSGREPV